VLIAGTAATSASAAPPGRGYELVSTVDTNLGDVLSTGIVADDGAALSYASSALGGDTSGVHTIGYALARRGASAWTGADVLPPGAAVPPPNAAARTLVSDAAPGLGRTLLLSSFSLAPDDQDGKGDDLYLSDGTGLRLLSRGETLPDTTNLAVVVGGSSRDLRHVVFRFPAALVPGAPAGGLYEWADGALRLVSVLPDGTPAPATSVIAAPPSSNSGTHNLPAPNVAFPHGGAHAVSDDGARIFFKPSSATTPLYLREGGARTVAISASQRAGSEGTPGNARFVGATPDGSVVYFLSAIQLTDAATAGGGLYRYDVDAGELVLVTPDSGGVAGQGGGIVDAVASEDGSHVYFISTAALAPGGVAGQRNAYVWNGDATTFLGTVGTALGTNLVQRVSRSGRFAVFSSTVSMDGAPTNGRRALFAYDAASGDLACVSCRPDGSPSQGDATLTSLGAGAPDPDTIGTPRNITDDGRVYFNSDDRLAPGDINAAYDVYEYHDGALALVSGGRGDHDSFLADNGDDGRDVFFVTRDALVAGDADGGSADLYDARLGGGFPEPPSPAPGCRGDDCQGPAPVAPTLGVPASSLLLGAGDAAPPAAAAPRALRLREPGARAVRRLVRSGSTLVGVRVVGGGVVRLRATARLGGRVRTLGTGRRRVQRTRTVTAHVRLRLTAAARRLLAREGRLRLTVEARLARAEPQRIRLTLTRPGGSR
jgi:hypothetical protein